MGGGFGVASTSGTINARSQTALSREAAPPAKHRFVVWVIVAVLAGLYVLTTLSNFGTGTLLMLGATAGSIVMARRARHFNLREHPGLMSNWEKSFMCNRCGQVFVS
jgi:hypothetical protein